jgi:hypothetical protein
VLLLPLILTTKVLRDKNNNDDSNINNNNNTRVYNFTVMEPHIHCLSLHVDGLRAFWSQVS